MALTMLALFMLGFLTAFVQSRRVTETSVMHAAATSLIYGIIEQIKQLDYVNSLPSAVADPGDPSNTTPPLIRIRLNQNTLKWLRVVYTTSSGTPLGPLTTPAASATAASVGGGAIDNVLGALPLSNYEMTDPVTGAVIARTTSQSINLNLWIWIDEIPNVSTDVSDVKRVTLIYTYSYQTGGSTRTVRNREVFLRTRYDQ